MNRLWIATLLLGSGLAAPPDRTLPQAVTQADCLVLAPERGDATVLLPNGLITGPTAIVVSDERIVQVAERSELDRAEGSYTYGGRPCAAVDTTGHTLMPGLVEVSSQLGLVEVGLEQGTVNANAGGEHRVRAALRVADAYDPASVVIPVQRVEGITSALAQPTGGLISGRAAFVDLAGSDPASFLVSPEAAMVASLPGESRAATLAELREVLDDADAYRKNRAAYERNAYRTVAASRLDLQALWPVLDGRVPLIVRADRAVDVRGLLDLAEQTDIRLILSGGAEAWQLAERLANARVPVIVDPLVYGPGGFDQVAGRADNAALLADAGVPVILSSFSTHNARTLRQVAGNAVRGGLGREQALRSISTVPARLFGAADRGELRAGQVANIAVFSGDPLEVLSSTAFVVIRGRPIPLDSRQWQLSLRYLELPGAPALPELP